MASIRQKIAAEQMLRELLDSEGIPPPDDVEYGHTCIRALWLDPKVALVVDLDEPDGGERADPERAAGGGEPELGEAA